MRESKLRILIVEDDAVLCRGLARLFPSARFSVMQLSDGREAIAVVSSSQIDLVICDYRLPGADGLAVLTSMRFAQPGTPLILVTAHYSETLVDEACELGANAVIEKPIDLGRLTAECEKLLGITMGRSREAGASS